MSSSRTQIYLIIGFVFAEGGGCAVRKHSFCLRRVSASPDRCYPETGSGQHEEVQESEPAWLIINASQRPPDIIFTLLLPPQTTAGGEERRKNKILEPRILGEGHGRGRWQSEVAQKTSCPKISFVLRHWTPQRGGGSKDGFRPFCFQETSSVSKSFCLISSFRVGFNETGPGAGRAAWGGVCTSSGHGTTLPPSCDSIWQM